MAFSSISVIGNSLLISFFRPQRKNYFSKLVMIVMIVSFTAVFFAFAVFSTPDEASMGKLAATVFSVPKILLFTSLFTP